MVDENVARAVDAIAKRRVFENPGFGDVADVRDRVSIFIGSMDFLSMFCGFRPRRNYDPSAPGDAPARRVVGDRVFSGKLVRGQKLCQFS